MQNNVTRDMINFVAGFVFSILVFIGIVGLFQALGDTYELTNATVAFASFLFVGGLGLISQLLVYNINVDKP